MLIDEIFAREEQILVVLVRRTLFSCLAQNVFIKIITIYALWVQNPLELKKEKYRT